MTILQSRRLYWPTWNSACHNQGWLMRQGRMLGTRVETYGCPQLTRDIYNPIWNIATDLAAAVHRAIIPEDLRHACHMHAFGKIKSSKDLTNPEVDKIHALFRILTDPDDASAVCDYLNPGNHTIKRDFYTLEHNYTREYIQEVCRDKFGHSDWGYLSPEELRELVITIKNRPKADAHPSALGHQPSVIHPYSHPEPIAA